MFGCYDLGGIIRAQQSTVARVAQYSWKFICTAGYYYKTLHILVIAQNWAKKHTLIVPDNLLKSYCPPGSIPLTSQCSSNFNYLFHDEETNIKPNVCAPNKIHHEPKLCCEHSGASMPLKYITSLFKESDHCRSIATIMMPINLPIFHPHQQELYHQLKVLSIFV